MSNKEALIRLFHKLDESGDGIISCDELYSGLSKAGVSPTIIQKLMDRLDLNGDGKVTFSEYETAVGINNE
ncbi:putative polcalcin Che a 3 (Calcium-binding pollen allergen Che a 3) [Schistosoma mansoni]|nr:putative polcalcin Che a 3 (Calcium-binding pollen allergen Che a 3) [Schistosoma mansoni]|eukprot:XP_018654950.1 putative polcalcin Che a 3 (Calcium-binding pollen allergen Che a 3) [Schistosoma mansoni]